MKKTTEQVAAEAMLAAIHKRAAETNRPVRLPARVQSYGRATWFVETWYIDGIFKTVVTDYVDGDFILQEGTEKTYPATVEWIKDTFGEWEMRYYAAKPEYYDAQKEPIKK